jgi:hypothetical protein
MAKRISLIRFWAGGFFSEPIDINNLDDIRKALDQSGAKKIWLSQLRHFDDWSHKGDYADVAELSEDDLKDLFEGGWDISYQS